MEGDLYEASPQPLHRMPLVIRRLPPLPPILTLPERAETFAFGFLKATLRGASEPPCCYHITTHTEAQLYPVAAWYAIDRNEEPFMPNNPGQHGAKLTLFMPEVNNFDPTEAYPLFVRRGTGGFMYYGTYKQPRYSDRLSYAEMELEVPRSVKEHRAKEFGKKGKAKWIVDAMKYQEVVETDEEAEAFGPEDILQAFQRSTQADTDYGLRLYWEYYQCVGYDRKLYDTLVAKKREGE